MRYVLRDEGPPHAWEAYLYRVEDDGTETRVGYDPCDPSETAFYRDELDRLAALITERDTQIAELREMLIRSRHKEAEAWRRVYRGRGDALSWHGRYAIVKHENNKLRRKLQKDDARQAIDRVRNYCRIVLAYPNADRTVAEVVMDLLESGK